MIELTGTWASEVFDPYTSQKHLGQLVITHVGHFFISKSASGWDTWHGYLEGDRLEAEYIKDGIVGRISARVSPNGTVLQGTWMRLNGRSPESGAYVARRLTAAE